MNSPTDKLPVFPPGGVAFNGDGDRGNGAGAAIISRGSDLALAGTSPAAPASIGNLHKLRAARRHDTRAFHVTLKQWRALHAVVDCGGFCEAAESLHLSQSAVSHAVAKLQEQFGIPLLRISGRKAELTEHGRVLLERSRSLLCDAMDLEQLADDLRRGTHAPVRLAVDPDFPTGLLLRAQRSLAERGHELPLCASELSAERTEEALRCRRIDLAVTAQPPHGFHHALLLQIDYVPVSHPQQRLCRLQRPLHADDLETELEIELMRAGQPEPLERHLMLPSRRLRWQVGSTDNAIQVLREGVGYAWLPRHLVQPWLERGALALLPLRHGGGRIVRLFLAHAMPPAPGSRLRLLADTLRGLAQAAPAPGMQEAAGSAA